MHLDSASEIASYLCDTVRGGPQDRNAFEVYRWARDLDLRCAEAWNGAARCCVADGKDDEAARLFGMAFSLDPKAMYLVNRAVALQHIGQEEKAIEDCRSAIELDPETPLAYCQLGQIYYEQGRYAEYRDVVDRGLAIALEFPLLHINRFITRALERDWRGAWEDWEYRASVQGLRREFRGHAEWTGEPLEGRTLLVVAEDGIGDQIMFSRWLWALPKNGRILLRGRPTLKRFLEPMVSAYIERDEDIPEFHRWTGLDSLPLKTGVYAPPPTRPCRITRRDNIRRRDAGTSGRLRVGLAWHGDPKTPVEPKRPRNFELWRPLLDLPGIEFQSLQYSECPDDRMRPLHECGDIFATARLIAGLDLVITADTMVAHLAATIGVPTWMLLYRVPEWRWEMDGERTCWYDSLRIIRQEHRGEWKPVFDRVRRELASYAAA